ncbi:lysozyme inhibitor LprI family protein [Succinimonas amylolytica]|uniref:lysozyme inhibitor LprI family protein n=1 Tax=Succinimonas amylolytica TaxID=83769 RepID=UPI0003A26950|nr:lysozyme inhibitor LprI family protein [Succinimonas amylolytica]
MTLIKSIAAIALASGMTLSLFNTAAAESSCNQYTTSYDRTFCFCKMIVESDKELNEVYKELRENLDEKTAEGLKLTQRKWIKYRNNQCENNGTIQLQCNYNVNKSRTDYLRERLRECKSGVCQNSLVIKPSW